MEHSETLLKIEPPCFSTFDLLQENINSGLPKTSDLKIVDFWLMGGMVVPFVVFVVLVVVEVLPSEKNHCGMIQEPKQKDGKYSEELQERRTYITKETFHSMFKFWFLFLPHFSFSATPCMQLP